MLDPFLIGAPAPIARKTDKDGNLVFDRLVDVRFEFVLNTAVLARVVHAVFNRAVPAVGDNLESCLFNGVPHRFGHEFEAHIADSFCFRNQSLRVYAPRHRPPADVLFHSEIMFRGCGVPSCWCGV